MTPIIVAALIGLCLYLLLDQLVLSARNRVLVMRRISRAILLGGRVSDFAAWDSVRMGSRVAAIDEARGILRIRSTWQREILLDLGIVTTISRPIRYKDDPYRLDIQYRIDEGHLPQKVHLIFEDQKTRDRWRAMLELGIKTARDQPRFAVVDGPETLASPPASGSAAPSTPGPTPGRRLL